MLSGVPLQALVQVLGLERHQRLHTETDFTGHPTGWPEGAP